MINTDQKKSFEDMPLISIVTIVYNGVNVIEKTILSVLNQSYSRIEYIIVDGGSTDGTVDIIKKYESQLAFWLSEPDKGISDAFNKGISYSKGKYVGLLNAGDWYEYDAVDIVVSNLNPKYSIYCGDLFVFDENNNFIKTRKSRPNLIYLGMYIMHPTVFVKRGVYLKYLFNIKLKVAMDYDLMLRLFINEYNFKYIPKVISNMMLGGVSSDVLKMRDEEKIVMKSNLTTFFYLLARLKIQTEYIILKIIRFLK